MRTGCDRHGEGALCRHADQGQRVSDPLRFVQVAPPGPACSIAFGEGLTDTVPGTVTGLPIVAPDADAALAHLRENGVDAQGVADFGWGRFATFADPDGNRWSLQDLPPRPSAGRCPSLHGDLVQGDVSPGEVGSPDLYFESCRRHRSVEGHRAALDG